MCTLYGMCGGGKYAPTSGERQVPGGAADSDCAARNAAVLSLAAKHCLPEGAVLGCNAGPMVRRESREYRYK